MTQDEALSLFSYRDGSLYWRKAPGFHRSLDGTLAGTISKRGYVHIQYKRKLYKAHQIVWLMFHGRIPALIDHINGLLTDNRLGNLRIATTVQNQQNARIRTDNSSGVKNVCWHKQHKWAVELSVNKKIKRLGYFEDLELADLVAIEARNKYHGDFANHGY